MGRTAFYFHATENVAEQQEITSDRVRSTGALNQRASCRPPTPSNARIASRGLPELKALCFHDQAQDFYSATHYIG